MQQRRAEQIRHELIRLCHAGLDSRKLRMEIMKRLRVVVPIDLAFFGTADPATLLFTGAVVDESLERATPQLKETDLRRLFGRCYCRPLMSRRSACSGLVPQAVSMVQVATKPGCCISYLACSQIS